MKKIITTTFLLFPLFLLAQNPVQTYSLADKYAMVPKQVIESASGGYIVACDITKNETSKPGLLYLDKQHKLTDAWSFEGDNYYAINHASISSANTLLVAAEGYSKDKQESLYFMEVADGKIINSFIFNEQGNELDTYTIVETADKNILIGGFIKNRELVSSIYYDMYKEDQFIYYGVFSKTGTKLWANGIKLDDYDKGVCNSIVPVSDGYILLCQAHSKSMKEQFTRPLLIKINKSGDVVKILSINQPAGENMIISDIVLNQGELYGAGSYKTGNHTIFFTLTSDLNLTNIKTDEYLLDYPVTLASVKIDKDQLVVCGSAITKTGSYDNLVCRKSLGTSAVTCSTFGTPRFEKLNGSAGDVLIGNIFGADKDAASSLTIFDNKTLAPGNALAKASPGLASDYQVKYSIVKKFGDSKMNKGISKARINSIKNNLRSTN